MANDIGFNLHAVIHYDPLGNDFQVNPKKTELTRQGEGVHNSTIEKSCLPVALAWPNVYLVNPPEVIDTIYVCKICLYQYDLVEDLHDHMLQSHKCKPLANNDGIENIFKVVKGTHNTRKFSAPIESTSVLTADLEICPLPFRDFRLLLRSKLNLRCIIACCPYKFENEEKRNVHTKCHSELAIPIFKCCECGIKIRTWRRCSLHLWSLHQLNVDLLKCPICDYKAHESVLVWRHMRCHKAWRERVVRSLQNVQNRRQYQVAEQKKFVQVPSQNKYYAEKTCDVCFKVFVNGKTLSKHVKTVHNKIKPFICNVCGKKSARKASLIIHMRQHTGEKPLQCKSCKFCTRDPSTLHKHQQRHQKVSSS